MMESTQLVTGMATLVKSCAWCDAEENRETPANSTATCCKRHYDLYMAALRERQERKAKEQVVA